MTKQELINQLENIIESLKDEESILRSASINYQPSHDVAKDTNVFSAFKSHDRFVVGINLEYPMLKEVD